MNTSQRAREEIVVKQLRSKFESDGYHFFEYPTPDLLPRFLGSYRPDAIAIGRDRSVAIEVKAQRSPVTEDRLAHIARLFDGHPEWEFRVVVAPRSDDEQDLNPASRSELLDALTEAETLAREGRSRLAIVLSWSVVEAYARLLGVVNSSRTSDLRQVVQNLIANGILTQRAGALFRSMIPIRNAVVHGDFQLSIDASQVASFLEEARTLIEQDGPPLLARD